MNRHRSIARRGLALLALLACVAPPAAGATPPCAIYRSSAAATAGTGAPLAVVTLGPWEDAPGLLSDGGTYFFLVKDATGSSLPLSVDKNRALDTVRLGFDDGQPSSAPVSPATSSVTVAPASVWADGQSSASITIVPRDAAGLLLGAGLAVSVDPTALWPGALVGPIVDSGNGRYVGRVTSSYPGQGAVWASVEGTSLTAEPTIDYLSTGPATLRDLAIQQLDQLTSTGGAFDLLVAGLDPNTDPGAASVVEARNEALDALATLLTGAPGTDDDAIRGDLKKAVIDLVAARANPGQVDPADILSLIDDVLTAARSMAQYWIGLGAAECGSCTQSGNLRQCQAEVGLLIADAARSAGGHVTAVNHYGLAIERAQQAVASCG